MCRGCRITKGGESTTYEYLEWLGDYHYLIVQMKKLEKKLLDFQGGLDDKDHKKALDSHRRKLIRLRKEYAKAENVLNSV